ncbi:iron chaperone [Flavihumibacter profundi]|uniref:iron chaperone n=1 Tax=Flavihumibacter profundi TaxID=2716883 RepID=UPI001CC77853|nr:DUF1801 domain-containing protein [Flavihumibacter profundi]MBZ5856021.1 DUF1801 domain-containing protein [Flavihumibacter profundi]
MAATIDEYIAGFPKDIQVRLEHMRAIIRKAAPEATETIGYGIPTFKLDGNLVHFGGFKAHIGFFPAPSGLKEFQEELSNFKGSKGGVQFPYDQPLPVSLITKIVKYRIGENQKKALAKKARAKK